ncbi:MAG: hypothetical protein Q7I94_05620, partial [Candidatus Contubernalis sp.]|nr:hypothetical protein [Candidatus Contubernalis sp.]
ISESTEIQSASVEEIVASINEQKTVLDEVSDATVELSHMADGLNELLEMYKFESTVQERDDFHDSFTHKDSWLDNRQFKGKDVIQTGLQEDEKF